MAAKRIVFDPTRLKYARWQYEYTDTPNQVIADTLGCAKSTMHIIIKEQGWRPRLVRAPRLAPMPAAAALPDAAAVPDASAPTGEDPSGAPPQAPAPRAPRDFAAIAAKLGDMIEGEIGLLRGLQNAGGVADSGQSERIARTVASLARTLRELQGVRAVPPSLPVAPAGLDPDDDDMPEDIDAFRLAFARKIRAFVMSRQAPCPDYEG